MKNGDLDKTNVKYAYLLKEQNLDDQAIIFISLAKQKWE